MILAIDQGTTSSRAIRFAGDGAILSVAQEEFPQIYPANGWVEHDPEAIWQSSLRSAQSAMAEGVSAIGITNQRETIILWDRKTGKALHNAIVWQDRRTADYCAALKADGIEPMVQAKTGLLLDPYFSATKLKWLLDTVPDARARAAMGDLAAGTVDSFLLWRLTGGKVHATDITNAGRTMLFNIHTLAWDEELLKLFDIPASILPDVHANTHLFGETDTSLFGRAIPIAGMAGDQQSALIGQACFTPGMVKSTYGTGCFMLINTGEVAQASANRLLTTPAYKIGETTHYALEGSIFVAGAAIKWLRDKVGILEASEESERMAHEANPDHGVVVVPGFTGLGAPYWSPHVRGLISGMTLDTSAADLVRATLEAIAFQTKDLTDAMARDGAPSPAAIRIDGGMSQNRWFAQFLADMLNCPVERPISHETTALGAAALAGITTGLFSGADHFGAQWKRADVFEPGMDIDRRTSLYAGWQKAIERAMV